MDDTVRWSLKVSRGTDEALRAHLGQTGGRKGDMSKFVQEAVRAKLTVARRSVRKAGVHADLAGALAEIRSKTRTIPRARFEKIVAEAVAYARSRRR